MLGGYGGGSAGYEEFGGGKLAFGLKTKTLGPQVKVGVMNKVKVDYAIFSPRIKTKLQTYGLKFKTKTDSRLQPLVFSIPDVRLKDKLETKIKERLKERQGFILLEKSKQKQKQKLALTTSQSQRQRTRVPYNPLVTIPKKLGKLPPKPPKVFEGKKEKEKRKKPTPLFTTEVRRRGEFKPIGEFFSLGKAISAGKKKTSKTLVASFKVTKGGEVIEIPEDIFFKKAKKEKGVLVQKKTKRLSAYGERREIQQARSRAKWW